jgi:hypothetical protein
MDVTQEWGMTVAGTDIFLDSMEMFICRLVSAAEPCVVMITDYAEGTMACLVGLLKMRRSGMPRVGEAAHSILGVLTRMSFVYEPVVTADGGITGATFTTWVEPPRDEVWTRNLSGLSLYAAHLNNIVAPLLVVARGGMPVGGGAPPLRSQ